jgi:hypothetical protein
VNECTAEADRYGGIPGCRFLSFFASLFRKSRVHLKTSFDGHASKLTTVCVLDHCNDNTKAALCAPSITSLPYAP